LHELFCSFQGEGILTGIPQVFVRLSGCNLDCSYCDTPLARVRREYCILEDREGRRESIPNPVDVGDVTRILRNLWYPECHSVSITGGEPLLQAAELAELLPGLRERGMPIYLETNGTLHQRLAGLLPWIDWVAMDIKLPSSQGGMSLLEDHRRFLHLALYTKVFLKMVVNDQTEDDEFREACSALGEEASDIPLVLQPATPQEGKKVISPRRMADLYSLAVMHFRDVRVIPQMHLIWGAG
jgi:7-carboxy-7-deazaguanine synthase